MKIQCRITFITGNQGVALWQMKRLKVLSGYFRSTVILKNISGRQEVSTERVLGMMRGSCRPNQLCQLCIEGSDAELTCMVLCAFIADQFSIVAASHPGSQQTGRCSFSESPVLCPSFELQYFSTSLTEAEDKSALLALISHTFDPENREVLFQAFTARESISSTYINHGIAFPHIMHASVEKPALMVIRPLKPTDWQCPRGYVRLILALCLPSSPETETIRALTTLSRSLLDDFFCRTLLLTREPEAIEAILYHTLAGDC